MLKILTWNIHKCVGTDKRRDPNRILDAIQEYDADIVVLQEVDRKIGANRALLDLDVIKRKTELRSALPQSDPTKGVGWRGNLILVSPDIECLDTKKILLPSLEPRGALLAHLSYNGTNIDVIGIHLGLLGPVRARQLGSIAAEIAARKIIPTIIAGDTNEWRKESSAIDPINGILGNAGSSINTFPATTPIFPLDRIVAGRGAKVVSQEVMTCQKASDHLPVLSHIKFCRDG